MIPEKYFQWLLKFQPLKFCEKKESYCLLIKIGSVKQYDWWFSHDKLTIRSSLCSIAINRLHSVYSLNKICILLYHIWSIFCQCSHFILTLKTSENQSFFWYFQGVYIFLEKPRVTKINHYRWSFYFANEEGFSRNFHQISFPGYKRFKRTFRTKINLVSWYIL